MKKIIGIILSLNAFIDTQTSFKNFESERLLFGNSKIQNFFFEF